MARYYQMMERLRQETSDTGADLMITVPDRDVSRLQSEMARLAAVDRQLAAGGLEVKFGTGVGGGDWFGWIFSLLDHVDRREAHPIKRPASTTPDAIPDVARIAMTADWGTGLYGAPKIADQIRRVGGYELLMHLGDIYYSGTKEEVQERFLDVWPRAAGQADARRQLEPRDVLRRLRVLRAGAPASSRSHRATSRFRTPTGCSSSSTRRTSTTTWTTSRSRG